MSEINPQKYVMAVDVETSGQYFTRNAMIAFACSVMDAAGKEVEHFRTDIEMPMNREFEKTCWDTFWCKNLQTLEKIQSNAKDPQKEMIRFALWLDDMDLKYGRHLMIVSDNKAFDIGWLNYYLSVYTTRPLMSSRLLSINTMTHEMTYVYRNIVDADDVYRGVLHTLYPEDDELNFNWEEKLGIQNKEWKNDHDPSNDARNIAANYVLYRHKYLKK